MRTYVSEDSRWQEYQVVSGPPVRIPEGKNVGDKLRMADFMKDDFRAIYGNPAGSTRRAIISRGRKNAKTMEAACIILLHLCGVRQGIASIANSIRRPFQGTKRR